MWRYDGRMSLAKSLQSDRRIASRYDVALAVEVFTLDGVPLSAEVSNISASGFRASSSMIMPKGTKLFVRFQGGSRRRVVVAWQIGQEIGCRLVRPLRPEQLRLVVGS